VKNCFALVQQSLTLLCMLWPICKIIARNRNISEFFVLKWVWSFVMPVQILLAVSVSFCHQRINKRCKIQNEDVQRQQILIYVWSFNCFLPLSPVNGWTYV